MNIGLVSTGSKDAVPQELDKEIGQRLAGDEAEALSEFCHLFLDQFPFEDWGQREIGDLYGCCYGLWRFIKTYSRQESVIKVFNPNLEENHWECDSSVITVLQQDQPFLVDSLRLELNRRDIAIRTIKSTVMMVARNAQHELIELRKPGDDHEVIPGLDYAKEALIYIEIDLSTDPQDHIDLANALTRVLLDVDRVVADYQPMLDKVGALINNISYSTSPQVKESQAFLQWLKSSHFTFLGYREYTFSERQQEQCLQEDMSARLGVFCKLTEVQECLLISSFSEGMRDFHQGDDLIAFSKSATRSNVHRSAYPDYVVIKRFDKAGKVCGEIRLLGLYTYAVYTLTPMAIPIIREKVAAITARSGWNISSHSGKNLHRVFENFPRDELFQTDTDSLYNIIMGVASINERHVVRLFMRKDPFGHFVNCIVYVPRDVFSTHIRIKIQNLIGEAIGSQELDFTSHFSESVLARVHLIFKVSPDCELNYDVKQLEAGVINITRTWQDQLQTALLDSLGEEQGIEAFKQFRHAFSVSYQEYFDARIAVHDIKLIQQLKQEDDIAMVFYQPVGSESNSMRFKVLHLHQTLELSDVVPILENLGLRILGEHPYAITLNTGKKIWLQDFNLKFSLPVTVDIPAVKNLFERAFSAIWRGEAESDSFNRLVLGAKLDWREVTLLRAYAGYMKQTAFTFSQESIAATLAQHLDITRNLVSLFKCYFDANNKGSKLDAAEQLNKTVLDSLDSVDNLNEDRILRRYLDMINGTMRTNFFQCDLEGKAKNYISLKFKPQSIAGIPEPRPMFEIFVYSSRVEGVHLRGGKVARGGLRWSDRLQDYRTEVLGLVKAQQVKNAVIVPNGAKGGFVAKKLASLGDRKAQLQEGITCYKTFIRGLLDITDNLVDGKIVTPINVVRRDEDDPYLVVAADKGTATFSDIANEISEEYGHWLGDAFASGGSQGYDHKGMGITAKGAWVSVQRHFRERGVDIQNEDFTVVGIGDMAGDVFGNGMLLSEHICLVAAFNHMHIFIDPKPNAAESFVERQRLFNTPGCSWLDYNKTLISKGGGVFSREAKSIAITAQMKKVFGINQSKLTPSELITALLLAPVDLIWNGGIGTYVKSSLESHADVGDKNNDGLRVNGNALRCKVFGEGGNLGVTQLGRVEYCLNGGACNTDFIDNAAGVDCSDHEVNIKILIDEHVANGDLTEKQRNKLLESMTDDVGELVLRNNYCQTQAISIEEFQSYARFGEYRRFIHFLENTGRLNRKLEFIPDDESLVQRHAEGKSLSRPELSVLISYAKVMLKEELIGSGIAKDEYLVKEAELAFPQKIRKKYPQDIFSHKLLNEIVATQVANDMVNNMGITFYHRLFESRGASAEDISKAYIISRDVFQFERFNQYVASLDNQVPAEFQAELITNMVRRVRRGTRWFLRNRRSGLTPAVEVPVFRQGMDKVIQSLDTFLPESMKHSWQLRCDRLREREVPEELLHMLAMPINLFSGLGMVEAACLANTQPENIAEVFLALLDRLNLDWFANQLSEVKVENYWQAMARETYIDDLEAQLRKLTVSMIRFNQAGDSIGETVDQWLLKEKILVDRWKSMVNELQGSQASDYAMFSVAMRELIDLSQATDYCQSLGQADSSIAE